MLGHSAPKGEGGNGTLEVIPPARGSNDGDGAQGGVQVERSQKTRVSSQVLFISRFRAGFVPSCMPTLVWSSQLHFRSGALCRC